MSKDSVIGFKCYEVVLEAVYAHDLKRCSECGNRISHAIGCTQQFIEETEEPVDVLPALTFGRGPQ